MFKSSTTLSVRMAYSDNYHMAQIFAGFQMLEAAGVVECVWEPGPPGEYPNCVSVVLDDRVRVHYDVSDGYNWIAGTELENLRHFSSNGPSGLIFKRSFRQDILKWAPANTTVMPLGLNYHVTPPYHASKGNARLRLERRIRDTRILARMMRVQPSTFSAAEYEASPQMHGDLSVMMYTRLWDPKGADVRTHDEAEERAVMNDARVRVLRQLRAEFSGRFKGGLYSDDYSRRAAPRELLLPWAETEKRAYLRNMKEHAVCVATTGLHGSTGWRFGEYVAASRAIVTEPLRFDPGYGMEAGRNYIESTLEGLHAEIDRLLSSPSTVRNMMLANHQHYRAHLRPDALILNSLLLALGGNERLG